MQRGLNSRISRAPSVAPGSRPPSVLNSRPRRRGFAASARVGIERVVICGSGWAGMHVLKSIDKARYDVTMISPNTYSVFTPLLAGTAVGTIEFRAALDPVRYRARNAHYTQAWADSIDLDKRVISVTAATSPIPGRKEPDRYLVPYDKLVLAPGAYSQTFGIPGVKEHAYFLKDVKDARRIRSRLLELLEQASQPTLSDNQRRRLLSFAIVGGGPTGIEFAGELHDFCANEVRRYYAGLHRLVSITVYETASHVLAAFDESLQSYARQRFAREGITIHTGHAVKCVKESSIEVEGRGDVPAGMVVWSTGLAPNPLIESLDGLRKDDKTHSLVVNGHMHPIDEKTGEPRREIWAVGDCTVLESGRLPATAQVASQQGKYVVKTLNLLAKDVGEPEKPFELVDRGSLAYLGGWTAIFDRSGAKTGPNVKQTGRAAWILWRSTYLSMSSWRNTLLVPVGWAVSWIFGRDISRF